MIRYLRIPQGGNSFETRGKYARKSLKLDFRIFVIFELT